MIEGSKERKSLSGAIKTSKANSTKFWNAVNDKIKKNDVTPAWIVKRATDNEKYLLNKDREFKLNEAKEKIDRVNWSAWGIEKIVRRTYQES